MQSTFKYIKLHDITINYNSVHYHRVQLSALQYSTVQYSTVQYSTAVFFRGFDEDYVNDEENALSASFSKSRNLEDMAQFPSNLSIIKIDLKCFACFLFPRKLFYISHKFLVRHLCVSNHFPTALQAEHWSQCGQKGRFSPLVNIYNQ